MTEGLKHDVGKLRLDLLPPELEEAVAEVLGDGCVKYGERNWELGLKWSRVYAATRRHLLAWWKLEPADPESGRSHLAHAACCIAFLLAYEGRGAGTDDRPGR